MKKLLLTLFAVLVLAAIPATGVFAATTATVTVTATPGFIGIANDPNTWPIGVITINTTYYANPLGGTTAPSATVVDGECRWTLTNSSTVTINVAIDFNDFAGGNTMTNGNTGSNGATTFGAYSYLSGSAYPGERVTLNNDASTNLISNMLAATTTKKWGAEMKTRTDAWTTGDALTATIVLTATAA